MTKSIKRLHEIGLLMDLEMIEELREIDILNAVSGSNENEINRAV